MDKINEYLSAELPEIGKGVSASVFKGYNSEKQQYIALKVFKNNDEILQDEIKLLMSCQNENIVQFYRQVNYKNKIAIEMEFCDTDLNKLIQKKYLKGIPENKAINFFQQLLSGLSYIHANNIIHRDIKPHNILIKINNNDLDSMILKISDFGISKQLNRIKDLTETLQGTPVTLAPEIFDKQPYNYKVDIFSLGIVFFYIIQGKYPFLGDFFQIQNLKKLQLVQFIGDVSPKIQDMIKQMIKPKSNERIDWPQLIELAFEQSNERSSVLKERCLKNCNKIIKNLSRIKILNNQVSNNNSMNIQNNEHLNFPKQIIGEQDQKIKLKKQENSSQNRKMSLKHTEEKSVIDNVISNEANIKNQLNKKVKISTIKFPTEDNKIEFSQNNSQEQEILQKNTKIRILPKQQKQLILENEMKDQQIANIESHNFQMNNEIKDNQQSLIQLQNDQSKRQFEQTKKEQQMIQADENKDQQIVKYKINNLQINNKIQDNQQITIPKQSNESEINSEETKKEQQFNQDNEYQDQQLTIIQISLLEANFKSQFEDKKTLAKQQTNVNKLNSKQINNEQQLNLETDNKDKFISENQLQHQSQNAQQSEVLTKFLIFKKFYQEYQLLYQNDEIDEIDEINEKNLKIFQEILKYIFKKAEKEIPDNQNINENENYINLETQNEQQQNRNNYLFIKIAAFFFKSKKDLPVNPDDKNFVSEYKRILEKIQSQLLKNHNNLYGYEYKLSITYMKLLILINQIQFIFSDKFDLEENQFVYDCIEKYEKATQTEELAIQYMELFSKYQKI